MEKSPSPTTSSTPDKPATPSAEQPHNGIATDMGEATVDSVQHATRDPRFGPGVRKAFFSTELGTRTPRRLDRALVPAVARSTCDAVAVIEAANYWQVKYKSEYTTSAKTHDSVVNYFQGQCLCIFPNQGWIVEDLWDDTDIHIEGRGFCEQMLTLTPGMPPTDLPRIGREHIFNKSISLAFTSAMCMISKIRSQHSIRSSFLAN